MSLEIEIKYLIFETEIQQYFDYTTQPKTYIEQYYFSPQKINEFLLPLVTKKFPTEVKELPEFCNNGRVRLSRDSKKESYSLTVKAPRKNIFSRLELEFSINQSEFERLKNLADYGYLIKNRYEIQGELCATEQKKLLTAEIDEYLEIAGNKLDLEPNLKFVVVEIEAESDLELSEIRSGKHNFSFLSKAVELMSLPETLQPNFKNTVMAREGISLEKLAEVRYQMKLK